MCEPPKPRSITGIGAMSEASVSFHFTMLDEPTKSTWQGGGGDTRSARTNCSTSAPSDRSSAGSAARCPGAGAGAAASPATAADTVKVRTQRVPCSLIR